MIPRAVSVRWSWASGVAAAFFFACGSSSPYVSTTRLSQPIRADTDVSLSLNDARVEEPLHREAVIRDCFPDIKQAIRNDLAANVFGQPAVGVLAVNVTLDALIVGEADGTATITLTISKPSGPSVVTYRVSGNSGRWAGIRTIAMEAVKQAMAKMKQRLEQDRPLIEAAAASGDAPPVPADAGS